MKTFTLPVSALLLGAADVDAKPRTWLSNTFGRAQPTKQQNQYPVPKGWDPKSKENQALLNEIDQVYDPKDPYAFLKDVDVNDLDLDMSSQFDEPVFPAAHNPKPVLPTASAYKPVPKPAVAPRPTTPLRPGPITRQQPPAENLDAKLRRIRNEPRVNRDYNPRNDAALQAINAKANQTPAQRFARQQEADQRAQADRDENNKPWRDAWADLAKRSGLNSDELKKDQNILATWAKGNFHSWAQQESAVVVGDAVYKKYPQNKRWVMASKLEWLIEMATVFQHAENTRNKILMTKNKPTDDVRNSVNTKALRNLNMLYNQIRRTQKAEKQRYLQIRSNLTGGPNKGGNGGSGGRGGGHFKVPDMPSVAHLNLRDQLPEVPRHEAPIRQRPQRIAMPADPGRG